MTRQETTTRSVRMERHLNHPPAKVWRALTQPHLMKEWLMQADNAPAPGQTFRLTADWGELECRVISMTPESTIAYTWGDGTMDTTVTWTLTPTPTGTMLRME